MENGINLTNFEIFFFDFHSESEREEILKKVKRAGLNPEILKKKYL